MIDAQERVAAKRGLRTTLYCEVCGKEIPNRPDRKTATCLTCWRLKRCQQCGQQLGMSEHICASVDLKGERFCSDCGKLLSQSGYERWKTRCPQCEKKRWRDKERAIRAELKHTFGGACSVCGYDRCDTALHFHHLDDSAKYDWNVKGKGGSSIREIQAHPERFQLLCANCHIEIHAKEALNGRSKAA